MAEPQIPEQFEEAQTTPVVIKEEPVLGPTLATGKPEGVIPEEAAKDVTVQKEGVDFRDVLAGNVTQLGGLNITPKALEAAKKNPALMRKIKATHAIAGQPTPSDQPTIPFMREGEFVPTPELIANPYDLEKAERIAMNRSAVDNVLTQANIQDPLVRQVMIDKYRTGEFFDNLNVRLAEAGQFFGTAIPMGTVLGSHAIGAWQDATRKGTSWSAEWGARQRDIQSSFDSIYQTIDKVIPRPTMTMAFNDFIREDLQTRLDNNTITKDQFDNTVYMKDQEGNFMVDKDGNRIERQIIDDDTARTLLDLSFQELPTQEKYGVMFLENVIGMAGPGQYKGARALRKFEKLKVKYAGTDIGKAIEGKTDPFEVLNIMESMGAKTRINKNALSIGVAQQRTDAAQDILADQIAEAGIKLDTLRIAGVPKSSTQYKVAQGEYQNLQNRMLRAKYTAKVVPYVKAVGTDAAIISAGQLAAREYLPTYFEVTPETAEVFGMIGMIAGGANVGKALGRGVVNATSSPRGGIKNVASRSMDFLAHGFTLGGTRAIGFKFTDDTIKNFELASGKKLTPDELRGINAAIKMVNSLDPRHRETVVNAIDEYVDLRERIITAFPEENREEAAELFSLSFSNATGLNFLSAVRAVNGNFIDVRNMKGMDITSVMKAMEASQKQVEITEMALKNLEDLISRSDIQDPEAVTKYIANNRAALKKVRDDNMDAVEMQLGMLDDIRKHVLADPTIDIPEGFIGELVSADARLNAMLGNVVDERKAVATLMTDLYTGLSTRLQMMRGRRPQGGEYYRELGNAMETVMDTHLDTLWNKGSAAYDNVRKLAQDRPPIDLSNAVQEMVDKAGGGAYHRFFSAEGQFFSGRLGRQNRMVFNDMARRALGDNIERVRESLVENGISQDLVDGMDDFELALELQRISPEFKPFAQLNAYEVDVLRRSFRDYAFKIRNSNPELTQEYIKYEDILDDTIRADSEMYRALKDARNIYRSEVGDRLRTGLLYNLDKSRKGGRIVTRTGDDMFQYAYQNVNPLNMFKGLSDNMTKALQGNFDAGREIKADIGGIVTSFADTVDGKRVFDLTTEEGRMKFDTIRRAISEKVYADWVQRQRKVFERVSSPEAVAKGGYKMDVLADADIVDSLTLVPVRLADGTTKEIPLVDLRNIWDDARSLDEFVAGSEKARKQYSELVSNYNNVDSKLRRNVTNNIKKQDDAFDELKPLLGGKNANDFYQQYIIDGSLDELDGLRDMFIALQKKAGKSAEEAEALFDAGVGRLVAKGFKERGGLLPVATATIPASRRGVPVARQFTTPEIMLDDIRDHREKLVAVLGEDHVDYLGDIASFLARGKDQNVRLEGMMSGYSLNEGLSRLYNISRGMVSPLYVTSEYMVRIASRANIEILELAAQNKDAAEIISKMFKTPELITTIDMRTLDATLSEFVATEMARNDMYMPELNEMFLLPEEKKDENE